MTSQDWNRIKACFEKTLEVPEAELPQFLEAIGDPELRGEVESLLQSHRQAGKFLEESDDFFSRESFAADSLSPGQTIDRYRVIREIGRGGMGAVFLAERADDEYRKQVALKVIKRGTDTDSVLRHFRNERQILASLEHPNIARLLDGGTTGDGLPYFVMEYIEGERIDRYAEQQNLSIAARLELFRQVCAAVSYAHQHLVVHRDLKPSNILVTPEGTPKLLDFGIAKIIRPGDTADALATITLGPVMTPEYASPEQIKGAPATTLSDVYSLGVILYELLTGTKPFGAGARTADEISRAIIQGEPKRPSTASRINRKSPIGPPKADRKSLAGDLDNIVLMAMRRDTERRYRSVEQFSEDIRRHLTGRPVIARADSWSYRTGKFVQRNKIGVAAAALILLTLVGGIIATTRQARRAERRFKEVRKLANSVLFDYHDAIKDLPGATKVRERLVKDALDYLDSLAGDAQGDRDLQRELAAAYERVGDVRGGFSGGGSRGDLSGAIESYTKALRIYETLDATNPGDRQARRDLARTRQKIGHRLMGEADNGMEHLQKALTLYLDLTREQPGDDDLQLELADTFNKLGQAQQERGDVAGTLEQNRAALAICEKLVAKNPRDQRYRRALWTTHEATASALSARDDVAGAIEANGKALALGEALLAEDPVNAEYRRGLVVNYQREGFHRERRDKRGALEYYRRALTLAEELLATDPANALTRRDVASAHRKMAENLADLEENSQALLHFTKALELYEKLAADAPADVVTRFRIASCRPGIAAMQARLGEIDLALEECRKAIALLEEIKEDTTNFTQRAHRAQAYEFLGYAYQALAASPKVSASESRQHLNAARDMFRQTSDILEDFRRRGALTAADEGWVKMIADEIGKCDAALKE